MGVGTFFTPTMDRAVQVRSSSGGGGGNFLYSRHWSAMQVRSTREDGNILHSDNGSSVLIAKGLNEQI